MTIKLQTTKTQEKTHPRKLYKYKLFSWQRLFSNFVDLIKILPGGIYFKLIWCFFFVFLALAFSYEIYETFKNTHFEEHLQTDATSSSSLFKLDLVDLTVFPDLMLRLKFQPFTTVYQNFQISAVTLLLSYVIRFQNYITLFFRSFPVN